MHRVLHGGACGRSDLHVAGPGRHACEPLAHRHLLALERRFAQHVACRHDEYETLRRSVQDQERSFLGIDGLDAEFEHDAQGIFMRVIGAQVQQPGEYLVHSVVGSCIV